MNSEARIAISRLGMSECLVGAETQAVFAECLTTYASFDPAQAETVYAGVQAKVSERMFTTPSVTTAADKPFAYQDGVAAIPVYGVLLNKFNRCWGFVTGYNFIRAQMQAADADPDVKLIVFDVDSPGGDASGCFELTAEIRALDTPTMAVVDDLGASAAYAICAAPDRTVATPSASVGSIGVYRMLLDLRDMDAQVGLKFDFVVSTGSDFKLAGNPHVELTDAMREWFQEAVDFRMQEFVDDVIASRDNLNEDDIRGTQARVFRAQDALARGLIDAVSSPADAVVAFLGNDELNEDEDEDMALPKTEAEMTAALDAARAEGAAGVKLPDVAAAQREAVTADRTRRQAILGCDEAKDKGKLAATLADTDGMTVDMAKPILAAAATEKAPEPAKDDNKFDKAMTANGGAGVQADEAQGGGSDDGKPDDKAVAAGVLAFVPQSRRVASK
jgi:signal peptide peptidase SppA